jgi:hypothetical protein
MIGVTSILILCLLIAAGCTSIPGPEPRSTPAPVKTTVPVTPQVKHTLVKTTTEPVPVMATSKPVVQLSPAATLSGTYESRTCAQQGGGIVQPGQQCPGSWLIAADTFSCCSVAPVSALSRNASITLEPFDLTLSLDDDPGSILP